MVQLCMLIMAPRNGAAAAMCSAFGKGVDILAARACMLLRELRAWSVVTHLPCLPVALPSSLRDAGRHRVGAAHGAYCAHRCIPQPTNRSTRSIWISRWHGEPSLSHDDDDLLRMMAQQPFRIPVKKHARSFGRLWLAAHTTAVGDFVFRGQCWVGVGLRAACCGSG